MPLVPGPYGHYIWLEPGEPRPKDKRRKPRGPLGPNKDYSPNTVLLNSPWGGPMSIPEIAKASGIPERTLRYRYAQGDRGAALFRPSNAPKEDYEL